MKKIAIPVLQDNGENSPISEHFGHAPFFAFILLKDDNSYDLEIINNPMEDHGPGDIPNYLHSKNVDILVARGIGGRAIEFFQKLGIQVFRGAEGTIKEIMEQILEQKLIDREYEVKEKFHNH